MKIKPVYLLSFLLVLLSGCTTTFFGTVLVIHFRDLVTYVGFALGFGILASFLSRTNSRTAFWVCFLLSLVLTPIAGLIYCLILGTRKGG